MAGTPHTLDSVGELVATLVYPHRADHGAPDCDLYDDLLELDDNAALIAGAVATAAAAFELATSDVWDQLVASSDARIAAIAAAGGPAHHLTQLCARPEPVIAAAAASNPHCAPELLAELVGAGHGAVIIAASRHPDCPPDALARIVDAALIANSGTDDDWLSATQLRFRNNNVLRNALSHPNCPDWVINAAFADVLPAVEQIRRDAAAR